MRSYTRRALRTCCKVVLQEGDAALAQGAERGVRERIPRRRVAAG